MGSEEHSQYLTKDLLLDMFRDYKHELLSLIKDKVNLSDSLKTSVTDMCSKVGDLQNVYEALSGENKTLFQNLNELQSKVNELEQCLKTNNINMLPLFSEEERIESRIGTVNPTMSWQKQDVQIKRKTYQKSKTMDFQESETTTRRYIVKTERCGDIIIHVQGDVSQQDKRAVFLTVHDLGCNHYSFQDFVNRPCMSDIKERSIFIHVDVPGHEDNADTLPDSYQFPTLQTLGEELYQVLDSIKVKFVIGLGEGAGANVLARFGLAHPSRCLGLILINCTGSATSVKENFKAKFVSWKGKGSIHQSAEDYLVFHKFGHQLINETNADKDKVVSDFLHRLRGTINVKNVQQYVNAFLSRKDLPLKQYKNDVLLITGVLGSYANVVEKLHRDLDKNKATLLRIERAGDVLNESPAKVAHSILLFCKGQGLLTSVTLPGVERQRTFSGSSIDMDRPRRFSRGLSMEEYDKPNLRRLSVTCGEIPPPPSK
uniref:AB hydrolase-1 domain-containing protein n=1 Tax=Clastoptera arizonana TaxID=38151 RepID=A0A1B6CBP4_9HEMI